jgi:hypothetical protein
MAAAVAAAISRAEVAGMPTAGTRIVAAELGPIRALEDTLTAEAPAHTPAVVVTADAVTTGAVDTTAVAGAAA